MPRPAIVPVALPVEGAVRFVDAGAQHDGVLVALSAWTRATRPYAIDARGEVTPLVLAPAGRYDAPGDVEAREVRVKSHDGVEVPVSIVLAKGTKLDGRSPLLLHAYGAYGMVEEPSFSPRLLAWLERGGVYVNAHVRGGGILGDAWRRAGWKSTKPNTWKDGIAVAEWLIANGYTSSDRLAVMGGSAGGVFVGRAITERPDLFGAAVIAVGNVDSLRSETRANGAGNIPEYGTVTREDEFRALLAMSPYAHVTPGTRYPAVLFEHGVNDSRVDVWMPLKLASRLAGASTSGRPVLLRLDFDAGHGAGSSREQTLERLADRSAFLLVAGGRPGLPAGRADNGRSAAALAAGEGAAAQRERARREQREEQRRERGRGRRGDRLGDLRDALQRGRRAGAVAAGAAVQHPLGRAVVEDEELGGTGGGRRIVAGAAVAADQRVGLSAAT